LNLVSTLMYDGVKDRAEVLYAVSTLYICTKIKRQMRNVEKSKIKYVECLMRKRTMRRHSKQASLLYIILTLYN
jgi:hypothetical protein